MKKFSIDDIKDNSLIVDINDIKFNSWNPKQKQSKEYEKVLESVKVNGLSMPIIVREIDGDTPFEIVDGEQRFTACLDLGLEKVWIVNLGKISDDEAKAKTVWFEQSVPFDNDMLGNLLIELKDKVELPYSDNEIEILSGVSLKEDDEEFDDLFDDNESKTFKYVIKSEDEQKIKDIKEKMEKSLEEFNEQLDDEQKIKEEDLFLSMINEWTISRS